MPQIVDESSVTQDQLFDYRVVVSNHAQHSIQVSILTESGEVMLPDQEVNASGPDGPAMQEYSITLQGSSADIVVNELSGGSSVSLHLESTLGAEIVIVVDETGLSVEQRDLYP
jgi:hypothetical protein